MPPHRLSNREPNAGVGIFDTLAHCGFAVRIESMYSFTLLNIQSTQ